MTKKTTINIIISTIIVFLYFLLGHLNVKDQEHSEMGYFFVFLLAGIYSIIASVVTTIFVIHKRKYWNSVVYITSCLTNVVVSYIPITWLTSDADGVSLILLIPFSLPPIIFIYQIILFVENNKIDQADT